ncbi:MAG: 2-polyprenyl-3-methyl-6-methoxy-1,4-benzoquinone monooxygenase [Gammaproteobacteria bacterium]|jgi:ubiquinone biosynthesis monooxygenase Coq7
MRSRLDNLINEFDIALKTLSFTKAGTNRETPGKDCDDKLNQADIKLAQRLMRVNLAGEVAAQALYRGQATASKDPEIKQHLLEAGEEETDHLLWCKERLDELDGRPSIFNSFWYLGSFTLGYAVGKFGEKTSLGFVEETEKQVVKHLNSHIDQISPADSKTHAILKAMREDEDAHGKAAKSAGADDLKSPTKKLMQLSAKVMTTLSHWL